MKILVTGPKGFVGSRIMDALHAVGAPPLREASEDNIRRIVDEAEPDVIIHTAAISDIPTCEQNPEASYRANVIIPLALVRTGVKTVLFSSDQVYGGLRGDGPYGRLPPPISMRGISWRWKTARWRSAPIRYSCARPGCMTCPGTA